MKRANPRLYTDYGNCLEAIWFNSIKGTCGIVIVEDKVTKEKKAYVGVVSGENERADIEWLKSYGTEFKLGVIEVMARVQIRAWQDEIFSKELEYRDLIKKLERLVPVEVMTRLKGEKI